MDSCRRTAAANLTNFLLTLRRSCRTYIEQNPSSIGGFIELNPGGLGSFLDQNPAILNTLLSSSPTFLQQYLSENPDVPDLPDEHIVGPVDVPVGEHKRGGAYLTSSSSVLEGYIGQNPNALATYLSDPANAGVVETFLADNPACSNSCWRRTRR